MKPHPSSPACSACSARASVSAGISPAVSGVSRRDFIAQGSAALAMAALWGCSTPLTDPLNSPVTVTLSDYPALVTFGTAVTFWAGPKTPIGIVQISLANYQAFSLSCPHKGQIVDTGPGPISFNCPDGAAFNANGQWVGGELTHNLTQYTVTHDAAAGTLTIQP